MNAATWATSGIASGVTPPVLILAFEPTDAIAARQLDDLAPSSTSKNPSRSSLSLFLAGAISDAGIGRISTAPTPSSSRCSSLSRASSATSSGLTVDSRTLTGARPPEPPRLLARQRFRKLVETPERNDKTPLHEGIATGRLRDEVLHCLLHGHCGRRKQAGIVHDGSQEYPGKVHLNAQR